jgi:hypothetical protein
MVSHGIIDLSTKNLCILLVDNICGFHAVLTMNNDYFSRLHYLTDLAMMMMMTTRECALYGAGKAFLGKICTQPSKENNNS